MTIAGQAAERAPTLPPSELLTPQYRGATAHRVDTGGFTVASGPLGLTVSGQKMEQGRK